MREEGLIRHPVEEEGLVGTLLRPSSSASCPVVVALGGAGGGLSEGGAKTLASEGFAVLALAYFGIGALPSELVEVPLEYFERALAWLRARPEIDARRVAVVGNSKGAELALLLAATYPKDVAAVVGYAPSSMVWQAIPFDREPYYGGPRSPWSLRGEPLPFVPLARPLPAELIRMTGSFFGGRPLNARPFYERALDAGTFVGAASIAVERIEGPVLLVSGTADGLWPSTRFSEMVVQRLQAHDHPFPFEHLRYEGAGHMLALPGYEPEQTWGRNLDLGGSPEANEFANSDSWPKVLRFLRESLGAE